MAASRAMACFLLVAACTMSRAGELVITSQDIPIEVGRRSTAVLTTLDGQPRGQITFAIVGKMQLGKVTLYREAVRFGQMRVADGWSTKSDSEAASYSRFGAPHPALKIPLPLKTGMTYEYQSETGKVRARVEGPEEITVPAGKFTCLVCVEEREADGKRRIQKTWIAPKHGGVKFTLRLDQDYVMSLVRTEEPRRVEAKPGTDVLSTFDVGNPLSSPLFPKALWGGATG